MIFSVSLYGAASSGNQIRLGETKARYFKLTLYHGDNKPVKISKVTAYGLKKFAVFLPAADKKYSLSYGNSRAEAPSYDTARVLKDKQLQDFTQARLSGEIKNEDFVPAADVKPWTETKPYLLWAAMGAIGLGLAGLAIQVMKKTDEK